MATGGSTSPAPPIFGAAHPSVDLLTAARAVIISQRPVVGLSSWLTDVISRTADDELTVTLVTPATTRLTLPVRTLVAEGLAQWLVRPADGTFYDGLRGNPVIFDGVDFTDEAGRAAQFDEPPAHPGPPCWQVIISLTVEHRATVQAQLGGALEILTRALTGAPPVGWGVHEPVSQPWNRAELTTLARRRMPLETLLIATGADSSMIATIRPGRTQRGLEESVLCLINAGPVTRPVEDVARSVREALREVADTETVGFAVAHVRPGRGDLTEPGQARATPAPLAILVGPRAVRAIGRARFFRPSLPIAVDVGRPRAPGLLIGLGAEGAEPWRELSDLVLALGADRVRAAAPGLGGLAAEDGFQQAR